LPRLSAVSTSFFSTHLGHLAFPLRLAGRRRPRLVMDSRDLLDFGTTSLKIRLRNALERLTYRPGGAPGRRADGHYPAPGPTGRHIPAPTVGNLALRRQPERVCRRPRRAQPPALSDEPMRLVYAGIFLEQRNLLPLARAVRRAGDEGMAFRLSASMATARSPGAGSVRRREPAAVRVEQPIPYDAIPAMLAAAHIGVTSLPSPDDIKYEASSPLKLFEYMAAGLPVLATSNRCHTDVVGAGATPSGPMTSAKTPSWRLCARYGRARQSAATRAGAQADVHGWTYAANAAKLKAALAYGLNRHALPRTPAGRIGVESR
jgi:hypothetical protein